MKTLLFVVYGIGALCALICFEYCELFVALCLVVFIPLAMMQLAESSGYIRFGEHEEAPQQESLFDKAMNEGLSDQEAADKYGWALINEMDRSITRIEEMLKVAKDHREDFKSLIKEDKK